MSLLSSPTYSLTPAPTPQLLSSAYITSFDFSDTELPDTYKEAFEIYGNRSVASFLRAASAEFPFASDLIKWTEEGRLHTTYTDVSKGTAGDKNLFTKTAHAFRARQLILVSDGTVVEKGIITTINSVDTFTALCYSGNDWTVTASSATLTVYAFGSEFAKGTNGMTGALEAAKTILETNPIIIKDKYEISGSDMTQIGWVEVSTEDGGSGYLWYLKSEHETRIRYEDYLEMSMIEGVPADGTDAAAVANGNKGLFHEIEERGNVFQGVASARSDFDSILKRLDKQGAIMENMMFVNRDQHLAIDDFLAQQNSYGAGGTSFGAFGNSEETALKLGFSGFHRGTYQFYKTDWKYLNDATTRGGITGGGAIYGVLCPAGTKTVYDQILGKKVREPFLHVKYRKTATEDRKYRTWLTGGAGGVSNSDLDAREVHFLSERALVVIGANNYVLIKG